MFVGVGAARVRDLFKQAEAKAPCIVFIDELDALGKVRIQTPMGSHEEREQTLNQLLAEMDGFDARKGIIIMAATNRPEVLDPALLRPGRFDRQVLVDKPDVRGREDILRIHVKNVKIGRDGRPEGHRGAHRRVRRRRPRQPRQRGGAAGGAPRQDRRRHEGLRRGDRPRHRRAREEARDERQGAPASSRSTSRATRSSRPCCPGLDPVHKISIVGARLRRARLHDAAAARGSLPDDAAGSAEPAGGAARRPQRRGDRVRRGLDRRAERPAARHRHRARDGHRVRDERRRSARSTTTATSAARSSTRRSCRSAATTRGDRAEDRRRGEAHPHRGRTTKRAASCASTGDVLDELSERLLEKEVIEGDELRELMGPVPPKDPDAVPAEIPPPAPISS